MRRCFSVGASAPEQRPLAKEWVAELSRLAAGLQTCPVNGSHRFRDGLAQCPWCRRAAVIGRDPFPQPARPRAEFVTWLFDANEDAERAQAELERKWADLEEVYASDGTVSGEVVDIARGGLSVDIGLQAFLPVQQIERRSPRPRKDYVGTTIEAKITELDKGSRRIVLSRKAWLEQCAADVRRKLLEGLAEGLARDPLREGVVSRVSDFGVFVDLGGIEGLVHKSELSWTYVEKPADVVEPGQRISVKVLSVDFERERVSLSRKAAMENPWELFVRRHQIGEIIPVTVAKIVSFGVFVRDETGVEGLVHISELADRYVATAELAVELNEVIFVKLIKVELDRKRLSFSLRQADKDLVDDEDEFDPALYGMNEYDEDGNYIYPAGFSVETQDWLTGFEQQREEWENDLARANSLWKRHRDCVHCRAGRSTASSRGEA